MSEHRIRLAGPWQFCLSGPLGFERSERLPVSGTGISGASRIRLIRGFHSPPRLSSAVRMQLAFVGRGPFAVQLNGETLGVIPELSGGVTLAERCCQIPFRLLRSFNEVQFEVEAGSAEEWSLESVWLVISDSSGQPGTDIES